MKNNKLNVELVVLEIQIQGQHIPECNNVITQYLYVTIKNKYSY